MVTVLSLMCMNIYTDNNLNNSEKRRFIMINDEKTSPQLREGKSFVQIPMPEWMYDALKNYAADRGMKIQIQAEEFISDFLEKKKAYNDDPNRHLILSASPTKSKARGIWIANDKYTAVDVFAKEQSTRMNRVLFSACLEGLVDAHRVKI